jgi:hypothetical protein
MKLYYYQAIKKIDTTALIELIKDKFLFEDEDIVKIYDSNDVIYIASSRKDIMEEVENLYPNVFQPCEAILLIERNILFSLKNKY